MSDIRNFALAWPVVAAIACALIGCYDSETLAERCVSQYPRPSDSEIARDTTSILPSHMLPVYRPSDSLPQIYNADSSTGWFRNLFHADFDTFRSEKEIHSFILRFRARIVGRADTSGWYAVMIPDPGADTATFNLLLHCIGANYGVYVRSVYSRPPPFLLGHSAVHVPPN
jgi:hypothetical protein